ncbi:MAG: hypothetical protein ABS69_04675 [Nitrosomonadales bacterium SCN 54-20]|nr:MAG: hypothetical protein ABS69_04675 [Nitrosomonadales bacterium SCN 54-20]
MLKKLWADPVWSKVIAGLILASGAALLGFFFDWWPAISTFGKEAYNLTLSRTLLPNWLIGILGPVDVLIQGFVIRKKTRIVKALIQ